MHRLHTVARSLWAGSALLATLVALPLHAWAQEPNWSIGGYVGQYHGNPPVNPKAPEVEFSKKEVLREEIKIYRQPNHGCIKAC
jgi:hypothetical protein